MKRPSEVSRDLKKQLCMESCGKDVLKSWGVKIRMDVVTVLMGLEWGLLCCSHQDASPGCLKASRARSE